LLLIDNIMKIGFVCIAVPGHFNPMSEMARQLQARNHDVVLLSHPRIESAARAANLPFIPFGEKEVPANNLSEILDTLSRLTGEQGLQFTIDALAQRTKLKWQIFPKLLSANGIDALVLDDCDFYSEVVPIYLGMPYAVLSNALHFDFSGDTPLCVYDWAHLNTREARERNREGVTKFTRMLMRSNGELIAEVKKAGLQLNWENRSSLFYDRTWITQCPREFDFESDCGPRQFRYAGPFNSGARPEPAFPWDRLTGEPIVYASMGTIQNSNADLFRTIAAAASKKQVQLVISIGNLLRPEQITPVPNNAIVVNNAPQLALLKKAAVCITHAGFNTALEALTEGVPQVAIPVTNDQPGVAARIAAHHTGVVEFLEELNESCLSRRLDEVLNNSMYRDNARKLQQAIAKTNGVSVAADLIEEAFGLVNQSTPSTQR
jgi:zeaxanthin glucosyltransferase